MSSALHLKKCHQIQKHPSFLLCYHLWIVRRFTCDALCRDLCGGTRSVSRLFVWLHLFLCLWMPGFSSIICWRGHLCSAVFSLLLWLYLRGFISGPSVCLSVLSLVPHTLDYCRFRVSRSESHIVSALQLCSSSVLCWLFWVFFFFFNFILFLNFT